MVGLGLCHWWLPIVILCHLMVDAWQGTTGRTSPLELHCLPWRLGGLVDFFFSTARALSYKTCIFGLLLSLKSLVDVLAKLWFFVRGNCRSGDRCTLHWRHDQWTTDTMAYWCEARWEAKIEFSWLIILPLQRTPREKWGFNSRP